MTTAHRTGAVRPMSMRRAVVVLGLLEAFGPISMDLYMPSLPRLTRDLGTSDSLAQATMSACMLGLALGQLVAGPLSDRLGRRRPLLAGVALFAVLSLVCAAAPSIEVLLIARFCQGLAGSAGIVIALAVARDMADGVDLVRLLTLLATVGALAPIVAPVVGGQLATVMSWRGIFVILAAIGAALFTLAATSLRESLPVEARHAGGLPASIRKFGTVLHDRLFVCFLLVGTCGGAAFFTYLASISFVLQGNFSLSPQVFSAFFAANSVISVIGAQVNRAVVGRVGPERMYTAATTATALAALALVSTVLLHLGLVALVAALAALMFFSGSTTSNGSALALAEHGEQAGTAAALLGMSTFVIGPVLAPLVSLGGASPMSMSVTMAVAYGGAALLVWLAVLPRLRRRRATLPHRVTAAASTDGVAPLTGNVGNPL